MKAHVVLVGVIAVLLAGCTPKQEEVSVSNPCAVDLAVWVDSTPPPTEDVWGGTVEAGSTRVLTYDPDEPIQQVWISLEGGVWVEAAGRVDFTDDAGPERTASFKIPFERCPAR